MHRALTISLVVTTAALSGCASKNAQTTNSSSSSSTPNTTAQPAPVTTTLQSSNQPLLRITVPPGASFTSADGFVQVRARDGHVDLWHVMDGTSIDDVAARAPALIHSEFQNFKPSLHGDAATGKPDTGSTITINGAPARRLAGPGTEADDGDPGTAELIIFTSGAAHHPAYFLALTHGEHLSAAAKSMLLAIVQSATPAK